MIPSNEAGVPALVIDNLIERSKVMVAMTDISKRALAAAAFALLACEAIAGAALEIMAFH